MHWWKHELKKHELFYFQSLFLLSEVETWILLKSHRRSKVLSCIFSLENSTCDLSWKSCRRLSIQKTGLFRRSFVRYTNQSSPTTFCGRNFLHIPNLALSNCHRHSNCHKWAIYIHKPSRLYNHMLVHKHTSIHRRLGLWERCRSIETARVWCT